MEGWKQKFISKGGKEILIKTVIQATPQYAMSIFKIPVSLCKSIQQKIAKYWWQSDNNSRTSIYWKQWNHLTTRKDIGGLGFCDIITFNRALLGKQA